MRKEYRLCKNKDIVDTLHSNKKLFCRCAAVYFLANDIKKPQIAIVASKKNFNLAVTRNKIKRQVRSIVREFIYLLRSLNIVIIIKKEWENLSYFENKQQLESILKKLIKKE